MANAIAIGVVKSELNTFATTAGNMTNDFSKIESDFAEGMKAIWSTQLAAETVDSLVNAVNDYISQINTEVPKAISNFVAAVNAMLTEQEQATISEPSFSPIAEVSKTWTPDPENFNLPGSASEVSDLCSSGFSGNVTNIVSKFDEMLQAAQAAQNNGLAGGYVNSVIASITNLISSGQEVIQQYDSDAVQASVDADLLGSTEAAR